MIWLLDLENKNRGLPFELEFQIKTNIFSLSTSHAVFRTYLIMKNYLSFIWNWNVMEYLIFILAMLQKERKKEESRWVGSLSFLQEGIAESLAFLERHRQVCLGGPRERRKRLCRCVSESKGRREIEGWEQGV